MVGVGIMINKKWDEILKDEYKKDYFRDLGIFVKKEYQNDTLFNYVSKYFFINALSTFVN